MDRICLRGLRVVGVHGLLPEEQDRGQPFEIDIDIDADLADAGDRDDLADTLDYGRLTAIAAEVVTGESHALLERIAARIADEILGADVRAESVTVTVWKLRPPVPFQLDRAGVQVTRRRPVGRGPGGGREPGRGPGGGRVSGRGPGDGRV